MVDVVAKEVRSRMMAGIHGKNTKPELAVRKVLTAAGYRYRLHRKNLPGAPDIAMQGRRVAIFVHGCFWHFHQGCRFAKRPVSNEAFRREKLSRNTERDRHAIGALLAAGWRVLIVWECATRSPQAPSLFEAIALWVEGQERFSEIPNLSIDDR